jgi:2OG-Fe(II) oxygenase superfamily
LEYVTFQCPMDTDVYNPFTRPGHVTKLFVLMLEKLQHLGLKYEIHAKPFHHPSNKKKNNRRRRRQYHRDDDGDEEDQHEDDFDVGADEDNDDEDDETEDDGDEFNIPDRIAALLVPPNRDGSHHDHIKYGPWIVTIDDFVTAEQAEALIGHGENQTYIRSEDGVELPDGSWTRVEVDWRTSKETFCELGTACVVDPVVVKLMENITSTLGMPLSHCDYLQLLKYGPGHYYKEHHDYDAHQVYAQAGLRSITWYMYLNDVTKGGETQFPRIPVRVQPKKGRVLVWSNIRDDDPIEEDIRARHEALPVLEGVKYGATAWFHQRNVREISDYFCHD